MDWKVKRTADTVKIVAENFGWNDHVKNKTLCKLKDTNNGYIAKFPSHSSIHQDYYICLDYSQACDLMKALVLSSENLLDTEEREFLIEMLKKDQLGN